MADYNSSLPVRTEGDAQEKIQSKIVDYTDPSKGQIVDSDGNSHVEMHGNNPAGTDEVLRLSELGALTPDGVYDASNNSKPGNVGLIASSRDASPGDTTQTERLTSVTNGSKKLLDVSIHDENGAVFSASNPLPVTSVDSEGDEVNYHADASVVAGGSTNFDYTVTALKTLKLSEIHASASGKMKIIVQVETGVGTDLWSNKFVMFNSTANPNILAPIGEHIAVSAGVRVRVVASNRDTNPMDLFCTICGHEI